jgi:hypothetical protein
MKVIRLRDEVTGLTTVIFIHAAYTNASPKFK